MKSWAMPPASWPTASIFWACRSWALSFSFSSSPCLRTMIPASVSATVHRNSSSLLISDMPFFQIDIHYSQRSAAEQNGHRVMTMRRHPFVTDFMALINMVGELDFLVSAAYPQRHFPNGTRAHSFFSCSGRLHWAFITKTSASSSTRDILPIDSKVTRELKVSYSMLLQEFL